jgi:hypothetical protein
MDDWSYDLDRVETPPSSPRAQKGIHTLVIKESGNHVMNKLYDVTVLEKLVDFICTYALNPVVPSRKEKIESLRGCITFMTKYNQIPEVWVSKVHVLLRDMNVAREIGSISMDFQDCGLLSKSLKEQCRDGRRYLDETVPAFEDKCDEWMFYHPTELEFIFEKMKYIGWYTSGIQNWGVSDCLQFKELKDIDVKVRGIDNALVQSDVKNFLAMCRLNGPGMISMRQIYKDNDPYSLDLRIKVKELHELLEKVAFDLKSKREAEEFLQAFDLKSKREAEEFLQEIADKLWGWGKYEIEETDGTKHTKIYKRMDVLEVTGAPGLKAEVLNGVYVETDQLHNDRKLYKKVSMYKGIQLWLRSTVDNNWVISKTESVEKNDYARLCEGETKNEDPTQIKWAVYDADKEKTWKTYNEMRCKKSESNELVWRLEHCDVVINKVPAIDLKAWIEKGRQLYLSLGEYQWGIHGWNEDVDENVHEDQISDIMQSFEVILKHLRSLLTVREKEETTPTPSEEGECSVCMDRRATEVLLPCKHICVCSVCVKFLKTCPSCRANIDVYCNRYIHAMRTSGSAEKTFDVSKLSDDRQAMLTGLLLKLREISLVE